MGPEDVKIWATAGVGFIVACAAVILGIWGADVLSHEECRQQFGGCVADGCPDAPAPQVAVARAIHNVGFCPYCQTPVEAGAEYVTCPACKTPYHPDCWQENNGCAVYGCTVRVKKD